MKITIFMAVPFCILFTVNLPSAALGAEDKAVAAVQAKLAKELVGKWVLIGQPGKVVGPPAKGGRFKLYTETRWTNAQADPETGKTIIHKGGTYTVIGDNYEETVEFDNGKSANFIKQVFKFKIKLEGDTLTIIGIGNPWREVLKRVGEKSEHGVEKP